MTGTDINNKDMERSFLGSLLIAISGGEKINTRLKADDFRFPGYGKIYETILKQHGEGLIPTIITLNNELAEIDAVDIAEITNNIPSSANITFYENHIYEASKKRNCVMAFKIATEEIEKGTDPDTVINNFLPALEGVTNAKNESGIITAAEMLKKEFPPIKWVIPGLIAEGLTMLAGAPKIGKSWFVLEMAIAASYGGQFLDLWATKTETLYISLEDTERRLQSRLKILGAPENNNLKITTQWRDGYIGIDNYLGKNKDTGMVIIDTLGRFANIQDMNDYTQTTAALTRLKTIADKRGVSIVVVHHARKGENRKDAKTDPVEAALGSTGLTGTVDSTITLGRYREQDKVNHNGKLYATSRDSKDVVKELTLDIDNGGWFVRKDKKEQPGGSLTGAPKTAESDEREGWPK